MLKSILKRALMLGTAVALSSGLAFAEEFRPPTEAELEILKLPLGLDGDLAFVPKNNPITREKIELGRALYFDVRLSANDQIACATCHKPSAAFTDNQPVSLGINTNKGGRSAPTVINRLFSKEQFWDGRVPSIEAQAKGPITNPIEMGMESHDAVVAKLNKIAGYKAWFQKVFKTDVTIDGIAKAIATFERTVVSGNSAFDKYDDAQENAMTASQIRGRNIFKGKAKCTTCHAGFNFTDEGYHNIGVGWDKTDKASIDGGLNDRTGKKEDMGKFKTPTLRDIQNTAPYMHNGSMATLRQVVDYYDRGGNANANLDKDMPKLNLTEREKVDLVNYMKALNGEGWRDKVAPDSFPQ